MVENGCVDGCGESVAVAGMEDICLHGSTFLVLWRVIAQYGEEEYLIRGTNGLHAIAHLRRPPILR